MPPNRTSAPFRASLTIAHVCDANRFRAASYSASGWLEK